MTEFQNWVDKIGTVHQRITEETNMLDTTTSEGFDEYLLDPVASPGRTLELTNTSACLKCSQRTKVRPCLGLTRNTPYFFLEYPESPEDCEYFQGQDPTIVV